MLDDQNTIENGVSSRNKGQKGTFEGKTLKQAEVKFLDKGSPARKVCLV